MKQILVVIPYLASAAQGDELLLAVNGWRKHFKELNQIVVVGDRPEWMKGIRKVVMDGLTIEWFIDPEWDYDIKMIDCPRIDPIPGQYTPHLDHVHKFRKVREAFPESDGFIYTCDDIYPTADFTMEDILVPKHPESGPYFKPYEWRSNAIDWWSDRGKTAELCRKEGLPVRDWVCHLPVYYEWERLLAIYDKYDCDHNSYIVENIYFSELYGDGPSRPAIEYRDEVRTSNPGIQIGSKLWIMNANCGWSPRLEKILRDHYGIGER